MKHVQLTIDLFEFHELSKVSQLFAIGEHWDFKLSTDYENDLPSDKEFDSDSIIEEIEINEYLFFEDGKLANTQYKYSNGGLKQSILIFNNKEYDLCEH